jgi:cell division protein FtsW
MRRKKILKHKTIQAPAHYHRNLSGLLFFPLLLSVFGIFFVYEASAILSLNNFSDSFHYLKLQSLWIFVGLILMFFFSIFDYKKLRFAAFPAMIVSIALLILVLIPGFGSVRGGASGWINLGFFNLQPTEVAKLASILYLAAWFEQKEKRRFTSFLVLLGLLLFLIVLQPDIGSAIVIFSLATMIYFIAGKDLLKLLVFIPLGGVAFFFLIKAAPYRFNRLVAFMNPSADPLGVTYHINQILISLANGGLFGRGFGASRQKYLYLPEPHTDSIFAIIGEEFGFIGAAVLVIAFAMLVYMLYRVYEMAPDNYGKLLAGGIFVFFSLQILVNLGGMVNIMPLTGVPLPFISYGGSHILISFILMGIAINIARQGVKAGVTK